VPDLVITIPERIASDVDIYVRDPVHADPVHGDEEEATFLRGRAAIVTGWQSHPRGAVLTLPAGDAALLDAVWQVFRDLANRDDAAPASTPAYVRISGTLLRAIESAKVRT
jgi:hypothetical protein